MVAAPCSRPGQEATGRDSHSFHAVQPACADGVAAACQPATIPGNRKDGKGPETGPATGALAFSLLAGPIGFAPRLYSRSVRAQTGWRFFLAARFAGEFLYFPPSDR